MTRRLLPAMVASTGNTLTPQGPPIGKIRIANLISDNGQLVEAFVYGDPESPSIVTAVVG